MKKRILFSIYSITLIIALILFLIFNINTSSEKTTYAESLTLNCPRNISVSVNTQIQLLTGFISIEPTNQSNQLTYTITPKKPENIAGITLKDNTITANKVGTYTITFSIPKSKTKKLSETMTVVVERESEELVTLNKTDLYKEEVVDVNDLIATHVDADLSFDVENDKFEKDNDLIKPTSLGETKLTVYLTKNYLKRIYSYVLNIIPANEFNILIDAIQFAGDYCSVFYKIENLARTNDNVNQKVAVEMLTGDYEIVSADEPVIRLKRNSAGKIKLKIACAQDLSVTKILELDF